MEEFFDELNSLSGVEAEVVGLGVVEEVVGQLPFIPEKDFPAAESVNEVEHDSEFEIAIGSVAVEVPHQHVLGDFVDQVVGSH